MEKVKHIAHEIWSEFVWYAMAILICICALAALVLISYLLYLLTQAPWVLDGTNPRFGG